jgi:hypothetical protein
MYIYSLRPGWIGQSSSWLGQNMRFAYTISKNEKKRLQYMQTPFFGGI